MAESCRSSSLRAGHVLDLLVHSFVDLLRSSSSVSHRLVQKTRLEPLLGFSKFLFVTRVSEVNWGSTTQAQIYKNALQAVHQLNSVEEHVKNYRPQILVLSGMPSARPSLVDFASLITKNLSLLVCGHINVVSRKSL